MASAPVRRGALALILVGAVLFPGVAARIARTSCRDSQCPARMLVRWSQPLTGSWVAQGGVEGTVPGQGQAYAAVGHGVAVIGVGRTVSAYDARTGFPRWATTLYGMPPGSAVVAVRTWPGVVTVGVGSGAVASASGGGGHRQEVVLNAASGTQIAKYLAAASGGAVSASLRRTVVVGPMSVTSYANATGQAVWRVRTGPAEQAWRVDGRELYVTVSASGETGTAPVTAVRRISVRTGAERLIQPPGGSFEGILSEAADGVLVFSGADGLSLYSVGTGRMTGQRAGAVVEGIDPVVQVLYVDIAGALLGIDPVTGQNEPGTKVPGPPGTFGVRAGVALGLDPGPGGAAWGYRIAKRKVIWTTRSLPWPHYFVDLSGLSGSADPANGTVLLVTCAEAAQNVQDSPVAGVAGLACLRPRLVAIGP